jgi:PAT family beta-lactamase induction signal transducer AmpG
MFYRISMVVSSAGTLYLAEFFSWGIGYAVMAVLMLFCSVCTLFFQKTHVQQTTTLVSSKRQNVVQLLVLSISEFMKQHYWMLHILIILFFKLSDAFVGPMITPFLLEIGFTKIDIANILKIGGLFPTMLGVLIGGWLQKRFRIHMLLMVVCIMQMLSNLAYLLPYYIPQDLSMLMLAISIENFVGGVGTALFIAYLSMLCNKGLSATQYTIFSSIAVIPRTMFAGLSGVAAQYFGWVDFFLISVMLSMPALLCIIFINSYRSELDGAKI